MTAVLAIGIAASAHARDGSFAVGVQVVDRRAVPVLLDAIPVPPQARIFDAGASARSYAYPGTPEAAAAFFDAEMPRRGYRRLAQGGNGETLRQVWTGDQGRVLLQLRRVLGSAQATRIRIDASAAPRRPESPAR
ncbi:MAG TPA: hypothetical protein VM619_13065 [Luteimonas sp.]|nr:hypothetical protein [Luteimonas sp.]